ncbi:MAG: hypothetical protein KF832_12685 [Caldilineaceae bacterium]|nr:hypothetical protein [Caldilineaceae bacterium]
MPKPTYPPRRMAQIRFYLVAFLGLLTLSLLGLQDRALALPMSQSTVPTVPPLGIGVDIEKYIDVNAKEAEFGKVFEGQDLTFFIEVRNTTPPPGVPMYVRVTDARCNLDLTVDGSIPFPATPVSGDTNGNYQLDSNEVWTLSCTIPGNAVLVDFTNVAVVDACAVANCAGMTYRDTDRFTVDVINPGIYLEKSPPAQTLLAHQAAHFDLYVENTGDQILTNVTLSDPFCDGGAAVRQPDIRGDNDAVLEIDERWHFTCTVSDVGDQDFTNTAFVVASDPNGNVVQDYEDAEVDVIHPTIDLEKGPDPVQIRQGENADFTLSVANTGDQPLTQLRVVDAACDPTLTPLAGPIPVSDPNNNGILDPGETWLYTCSVANVQKDFINTASVTAIDARNNQVGDVDSAAVDVLSPIIDLEKSGPSVVILGDDVTFTLEVQNTGEAALNTVSVYDPRCGLAPYTTPLSGDDGDLILQPNEIWIFRCTVTQPLADFTNYARVTATDGAGNDVEDDDIWDVKVVNPRIFLEKSPKNSSVLQGANVDFTLNVRNLGDQNLTITAFSDPLCDNPPRYISGDDGDQILEPGEIWRYTCTVSNAQSDFTNVAVVTAVDPNGIEVSDSESAAVNVVNAGIDLVKMADTPQIFQGQTAKFTLRVTNTGVENLGNVDIIDAKCSWAEHSNPSNPSDLPTSGDDGDGILELNETWIYQCSIPNAVADFTNSARVKAREVSTGLLVQDTASASVDVLNPGINVEKTTTTPLVAQGATVTFQIVVQNTGQADLSNVVLQDALCVGGQPTPVFGGIGILQPTEKWQYTCVVTNVQTDFANTVTVQATDPASNLVSHSATAHVDVLDPSIDLEKSPENQTILAGGKAEFTLRIKNTGDLDLHSVLLTDAFCDGGVPTLVSQGNNDANQILSPNELWEYSCVRSSVQADFTNIASVTALGPANQTVSDTEEAVVNVIQPGLTLNKRPESQAILKGGTATFFLDATNTGDANLSPVTVSDVLCSTPPTLTGGDSNTDGKLSPGETWTYSCLRANVVEDFTNLATITFADATGNQLTRTDTAVVDVINSGIDIEKSANNTTLLKGQTVYFTLNVLNTGQAPLSVLEVKDPLCDSAPVRTHDGDGDADLDPNETWIYSCSRSNLQSSFTNVASVRATDANNNIVTDNDDLAITVINPAIDLEKTPEFQAVLQGETVEFILEVRNTGDQRLQITSVVDAQCTTGPSFLGGDTNDDGFLQTGEVWRYRCIVTNVTANFTNVASVTALDANNNQVSDTEEAEVEVVDPGIDLQKTADEPTIYKGESASFTIIVRNTGDQPLTITNISDPLCDAAPQLIGGDTNSNGKLDLSEFWIYSCSKANVQADFINTATVTADDGNGNGVQSSDTAAIDVINPGIDLEKSANSQIVQQGQNAAFTLAVRNTGQADLTNVVVIDALCDIGPEYITFSGVGNGNADGVLQPSEVWIYSCIKLNVQAGFVNEAAVTAMDVPHGNVLSDQDQAAVDVVKLGMNVKMQASSLIVDSGAAVEFTIVVRNTGEKDLRNITVVADTCPPIYQSGDSNNDQILQTTEVWVYRCNLGAVTGASATTVTVSGEDEDGNLLSSQDTVVITALQPNGTSQRFLFLPLIKGN